MKEDSKSSPTTTPKCYLENCRLGKLRTNPLDGGNSGIFYPLSPQINPPLALVKGESNTRGESQVILEGK
jgi:hypothetical protein